MKKVEGIKPVKYEHIETDTNEANTNNHQYQILNQLPKPNIISHESNYEVSATYKDKKEDLNEVKNENYILKKCLADVGKERDFYLSKLKNFEYLLLKAKDSDIKIEVLDILSSILYSTKDFDLCLNEEGEVQIRR